MSIGKNKKRMANNLEDIVVKTNGHSSANGFLNGGVVGEVRQLEVGQKPREYIGCIDSLKTLLRVVAVAGSLASVGALFTDRGWDTAREIAGEVASVTIRALPPKQALIKQEDEILDY